ncbi:sensor histidine kinase [Paenibacillus caseinilyticus]|uniref:sensor histidine kinase n=1 Tax=Paenibacillus caseinilyticus TaxID=3098138 RepID=UPI0022B89F54|nr:HAMP domain-containing sensor histidine kinase [Paenibacillus caseinilyticus]MCZ8521186.1 HAMP domain-containing sensor histidine kinase [Paenibacillus caseinilyticus]
MLLSQKNLIISQWTREVDERYPGRYDFTELERTADSYYQLVTDWHVPLELHPLYPIIPALCRYHLSISTPPTHLLQSSHLWRSLLTSAACEWYEKGLATGEDMAVYMPKIHARIDEIQYVISSGFWEHSQKQFDSAMTQMHKERLQMAGKLAASMAHEIRNPLTTISGFLKLLTSKIPAESAGAVQHYVSIIQEEFNTIQMHINNFLNFSKHKQEEPFREVSMEELIHGIVNLVAPRLSSEGIELHSGVDCQNIRLSVQHVGMQQVLVNLINNSIDAVQSMDPSSPKLIAIQGYEDGEHTCIRVTDNGPGIPPDVRDKLFSPFITSKSTGTGLGLAICKQLVEQHAGRLVCESRPGETSFTIQLLKSRAGAVPVNSATV